MTEKINRRGMKKKGTQLKNNQRAKQSYKNNECRSKNHLEKDSNCVWDLGEALHFSNALVHAHCGLGDGHMQFGARACHCLCLLVDPHNGRVRHWVHLAAQCHIFPQFGVLVTRGRSKGWAVCIEKEKSRIRLHFANSSNKYQDNIMQGVICHDTGHTVENI